MKAIATTLVLSLTLPILPVKAATQDAEFQKVARDYVDGLLASHPEYATELGEHRFDAEVTDYSPQMRERLLLRARQFREKLKEFSDISKLTGVNQVDVRS
jgi:hypothetical protein